jgi:hypothetical protein
MSWFELALSAVRHHTMVTIEHSHSWSGRSACRLPRDADMDSRPLPGTLRGLRESKRFCQGRTYHLLPLSAVVDPPTNNTIQKNVETECMYTNMHLYTNPLYFLFFVRL